MSTERLWLKGISSSCTDDFRTSAFVRTGLPQTLCALKTECLAEHWDVIEDEASKQDSKSGLPMFAEEFAK